MTTKRLPDSLKEANEFILSNITDDTYIPLFTKNGNTEVMKKIKANILNSGGGSATPSAQPDRVIIIDSTLENNIEGKAYKTFAQAKKYMEESFESGDNKYFQVELPAGEFNEQVTVSKNYFVHGNSTILTSKLNSDVCFTAEYQEIPDETPYISGVIINDGFMVNPDFDIQNYEFTFYSLKDCVILNNEISDINSIVYAVANGCEIKTQKVNSHLRIFAYYCRIHCLYATECIIFNSFVNDINAEYIRTSGCSFIVMDAFDVPTISGFSNLYLEDSYLHQTELIFSGNINSDSIMFNLVGGEGIRFHADDEESESVYNLEFNSCNLTIHEVSEYGKGGGTFNSININSNSHITINGDGFPSASVNVDNSELKMLNDCVMNGVSALNHSNIEMKGNTTVETVYLYNSNLMISDNASIARFICVHPFSRILGGVGLFTVAEIEGCADAEYNIPDGHISNGHEFVPKYTVYSDDKIDFIDDSTAQYIGILKDSKKVFFQAAVASDYIWVNNADYK